MKNDKKIAFLITSTGWGGLEMNTLKLAKLLTERGFEITLFTQQHSTLFEKGQGVFKGIEVISKNRKYFDFKSANLVSKTLIKRNINRLLVVDNKDLDVAVWCKKRYFNKLKIVYQQHMQIGINKKDWLHTLRYKAVDVWVSPLPFLKREIAIRTHFPLSRVKILPIGLETEKFSTRKYTKAEARRVLGIDTNLPLVGIIGRISRKKGQSFLLEALHLLVEKGTPYHVLIFGSATVNDAGDKTYADDLKMFVHENGLAEFVHFVDAQEDTALFYNAIDVFVLASHSETYGMVTIEAMLNELPILATDSGGTTEILGNGAFGTLYKYNDLLDFIPKLEQLFTADPTVGIKAQDAKQHALKHYDQQDEVNGFIQIFNDL